MPKVSILLTSYNHEKYIGKSIESILNQTYKDYELYIVDDCSNDNSWEVIKTYKDPRIIAIRHEKNMGQCMTKELIKKFKGDYIAIAHCDDKWEKNKLKEQVTYMEKNKNVAACFTHVKLIDEDDNKIENKNEQVYVNFNIKNRNRYEWLNFFFTNGNKFCHPSVLLRKKVQVEDNLHIYGLGAIPDLYRWVKLLLKHDVHIIEKELTCFRIRKNAANTSGKNKENIIRNYYDVYHLLDLYKTITDKEEFIKVFPSAKKYLINNDMVIEYAYARICMDINNALKKPYTIYGLNLLFEALQDDKKREKIAKLYNYIPRNFKEEVGSIDIYGIITSDNFMNMSIYYEIDKPFNEKDKLNKKVGFQEDGTFNVYFEKFTKNIKKIRIDLDEDVYRAYEKLDIEINGKLIKPKLNKVYYSKKEINFLTADPQIIIDIKEPIDRITISGKQRKLSTVEIENLMEKFYRRKYLMQIKSLINRKKR